MRVQKTVLIYLRERCEKMRTVTFAHATWNSDKEDVSYNQGILGLPYCTRRRGSTGQPALPTVEESRSGGCRRLLVFCWPCANSGGPLIYVRGGSMTVAVWRSDYAFGYAVTAGRTWLGVRVKVSQSTYHNAPPLPPQIDKIQTRSKWVYEA